MGSPIPGFVTGFVTRRDDPQGLHRIRAVIPALLEPETPFWIWPGNTPGGGGPNQGALYPPPQVEARVLIMFEYGVWDTPDAHAVYFPGYYGLDEATKEPEGPATTYVATTADKARQRATIWEDSAFAIYVANEDDDKRLVLLAKKSGNRIELNETSGTTKTGAKIKIIARTGLSLAADGLIDIYAKLAVQIMKRRVQTLTPDKGI